MTLNNPFNVYKGADSVRDYHDPERAPFLPLVEIPHHVNPYYDHGVRIYAKMMNALPAHNIKELPALNLLREHKKPTTKTVIEYSSGSTIISLAVLSRVLYGITDTWAYVSNKTNLTKLRLLQFFGLQLKLFGGPSTPDPDDPRGGIKAAENVQAQDDTVLNPNQYVSEANWKSHTLWTGPQLLKQLPEINVLCAAMGTTGTMSGVGTYLKTHKPLLQCLGVCIAPGNEIPGPRMFSMIQKIDFPWRGTIDALEEIDAPSSYAASIDLCRQGIICGPSSGMGYQGLTDYLGKQTASGAVSSLRGPDGLVHAVFLCCDLPYQYVDEYHEILGERYFAPIINENLFDVDRYTYSSEWELTPTQCAEKIGVELRPLRTLEATRSTLHTQGRSMKIVDLRSAQDFATYRIFGSSNLPLDSLSLSFASPFADANVMESQWKELNRLFSKTDNTTGGAIDLGDLRQVLLVCYTGDTSRVGTSILRAKGIVAFSLKEGMLGLGDTTRTRL